MNKKFNTYQCDNLEYFEFMMILWVFSLISLYCYTLLNMFCKLNNKDNTSVLNCYILSDTEESTTSEDNSDESDNESDDECDGDCDDDCESDCDEDEEDTIEDENKLTKSEKDFIELKHKYEDEYHARMTVYKQGLQDGLNYFYEKQLQAENNPDKYSKLNLDLYNLDNVMFEVFKNDYEEVTRELISLENKKKILKEEQHQYDLKLSQLLDKMNKDKIYKMNNKKLLVFYIMQFVTSITCK